MGPIRLRALQKAGWRSLKALQQASVQELETIPGMTPIKAQQLLDYLAQFPGLSDQETVPPALAPKAKTKEKAFAPVVENGLAKPAASALKAIVDMLFALSETEMRPRLQRELSQAAESAEMAARTNGDLSEDERAKGEGGLLGVRQQISDALAGGKMNRKAQGDLADSLAPYNAILDQVFSR
jgi:hypothetical protein